MAKSDKSVDKEKQEAAKPVEKKTKKADKNKKPNIFVRFGRKVKETFSELKRVTWPTFPAALKATGVVLGIVVVFLIITTGVNSLFAYLLGLLTNLG